MASQNTAEVNHLIEVRGIGKDYYSGESQVHAIQTMDFHIDDGDFVSIVGQSGSGKSCGSTGARHYFCRARSG